MQEPASRALARQPEKTERREALGGPKKADFGSARDARARNRANTGVSGEKKPNREWLGFGEWWGGGNRTRVRKLYAMVAWSPLRLTIGIISPHRRDVGQRHGLESVV